MGPEKVLQGFVSWPHPECRRSQLLHQCQGTPSLREKRWKHLTSKLVANLMKLIDDFGKGWNLAEHWWLMLGTLTQQ